MSQPDIEQLPTDPSLPGIFAGNEIDVKFDQVAALVWQGRANCKHGTVTNATYLIAPGVPPLNHAQMMQSSLRQHQQLVGCDCPIAPPRLNATVTFQPASAVEPGQQRYIPQASAVIQPTAKNNLWWGPGLTCAKAGAYALKGKVQLGRAVSAGATGYGVIIVQGVPVFSVPMTDEGGKATANVDVVVNLAINQSIAVGYENTSAVAQDVVVTSLTVSEVWVPG